MQTILYCRGDVQNVFILYSGKELRNNGQKKKRFFQKLYIYFLDLLISQIWIKVELS